MTVNYSLVDDPTIRQSPNTSGLCSIILHSTRPLWCFPKTLGTNQTITHVLVAKSKQCLIQSMKDQVTRQPVPSTYGWWSLSQLPDITCHVTLKQQQLNAPLMTCDVCRNSTSFNSINIEHRSCTATHHSACYH